MPEEKIIKIRAHHLLCIPRFYRGGYNKKFAKNMKRICLKIRKNPDIKIKVIIGKSDDICHKCPYEYKRRCVQSKEMNKWVLSQDKKVLKHLKLKENSIYKARDIFNLAMDKLNLKNIRKVCKGCIFLDNCIKVGINNSFRKDLNNSHKK